MYLSYILPQVIYANTVPSLSVVATTRRNGTRSMLTSAKLSVDYLVVGTTVELDDPLEDLVFRDLLISYIILDGEQRAQSQEDL